MEISMERSGKDGAVREAKQERSHNCKIFLLAAAVIILCGAAVLWMSVRRERRKEYEETLIVDVFDSLANYQGMQSGWFAKIVKDKFNMELNIIAPNVAGGGDTLYQTRAAAGNLGDLLICDGSNNNLQDLVTAGLVMDKITNKIFDI